MTLNKINYLNIGLMVLALVAAFILPFEVFLFSYAFLGPAHYLTEISWLHDRQYFSQRKVDVLPLLIASVMILLGSSYVLESLRIEAFGKIYVELIYFVFGLALVFILIKDWAFRLIAGCILGAFVIATKESPTVAGVFGTYVPTLIHVYVFTGAFILFGSLKSKSVSGYISFLVFLICPILCFILFTDTSGYVPSAWAYENYPGTFGQLNADVSVTIFGHNPFNMEYLQANFNPEQIAMIKEEPARLVLFDSTNIMIGRFIAFAYTYHYLNWFSKTSVIKWHEVSRWRFFLVVALWLASIALYFADYALGFKWLFFLSFAHVLLEFPLNHQSFVGIGKEIAMRISGKQPPSKMARAK